MESEATDLCPVLQDEEFIVVEGHHDLYDFTGVPVEISDKMNFLLTINRAGEFATELHLRCDIPVERIHLRGTWSAGDPRDPTGEESRSVTVFWGYKDQEDFDDDERIYQAKEDSYLVEWRAENNEQYAEIIRRLDRIEGKLDRTLELTQDAYNYMQNGISVTVEIPTHPWFVRVGARSSDLYGNGLTAGVGYIIEKYNFAVFCEGSMDDVSHSANLSWRPGPEPSTHWGKHYTGLCGVQPELREIGPLDLFLELAGGAIHVDYRHGPLGSLGFNDTAPMVSAQLGIRVELGNFGLEALGGIQSWKFLQGIVREVDKDRELATIGSARLTYRFW